MLFLFSSLSEIRNHICCLQVVALYQNTWLLCSDRFDINDIKFIHNLTVHPLFVLKL